MSPTPQKTDISVAPALRVIIVGGGVAGLTLAHCLEKHGIDFVLLEKRAEIAPDFGASIGVLSNGARILDQLGLFDQILELTSPLSYGSNYSADGKWLGSNDMPNLLQKRYLRCFAFIGILLRRRANRRGSGPDIRFAL